MAAENDNGRSPMQPSASKTALLLACPRPFEVEAESDPSGEAGRYGSSFHQVIAACLRSSPKRPLEKNAVAYEREVDKATKSYEVRSAALELAGHVKSSVKVLRNWLEREKLEIDVVEAAYAIRPTPEATSSVRKIGPHNEDHRYDVEAGEVPGTVDLIASSADRRRLVVIDHKTGGGDEDSFAQPAKVAQMRTLGLIPAPRVATELGIFHADRRGLPALYAEPYGESERRRHTMALRAALERLGGGFLRPGPQCKYCPVRATCPAHAADLLAEGNVTLVATANALAVEPIAGPLAPNPESGLTVEARAGMLYELLKKFRALEKAGSEEIKRLVAAGGVIELRDGRTLAIREEEYETLSKKSVIEALGKVAGEKVIENLRKKGALRETTRKVIYAEKAR